GNLSGGLVFVNKRPRVLSGASMLSVLAAVVGWRPGGGSPRPVLYASVFLVLASLQVVLGIAHMPALHVPLGTLMFALSVLALGQAVRERLKGPGRDLTSR
ncbi:hypothetical protein ACFQ6M_32720, partial [Streptomyces sp. NPDC056463]